MRTDFAQNLRRYREQAGYTMQEFSHMVNIPYGTYNSYENNQKKIPRLEKLIKIADILNVSIDDLVGRTPKNEAFYKMILKRFIKVD